MTDERQTGVTEDTHLTPGHVLTILGRGGDTRHNLGLLGLEHWRVVVDILDVDPDDHLTLAGPFRAFALDVQGVEEERNLFGGFGS